MNLIHHHKSQSVESIRTGVQHVSQYLGRHDENFCLAIDTGIPR